MNAKERRIAVSGRLTSDLVRDFRFGLRLLNRSRTFVIFVLLTLAFSVGANLTVLTLANAVWLKPVEVSDPERVVIVAIQREQVSDVIDTQRLEELRAAPVFEGVAGQVVDSGLFGDIRPTLQFASMDRPVETIAVTANYFTVLGVRVRGRGFLPDDDRPGAPAVAIISDRLWHTVFDGREAIIGDTIDTLQEPVTVIGIAQTGFRGARLGELVDVWIPRELAPRMTAVARIAGYVGRRSPPVVALARLRPGMTASEAATTLDPSRNRYRLLPLTSVIGVPGYVTTPLGEYRVLRLVGGMGLLVLLSGCATLAVLVLAHLERRRRELAIQAALGCGRIRLARSVLLEVGTLGIGGAALAVLVARWTLNAAGTLSLPAGLRLDRVDLSIHWGIATLGLAIGVGATLVAAMIALAPFSRRNAVTHSLLGGASTPPKSSVTLWHRLLTVHVAATVVMLVGAALFVRSLVYSFDVGAGFDVERTLFVSVQPSIVEFYDPVANAEGVSDDERRRSAYARLVTQLEAHPEVAVVAVGESPIRANELGALAAGAPVVRSMTAETAEGRQDLLIGTHRGGDGYLEALGLPVLSGEVPRGRTGSLVTRSLAERLWPSDGALGQTIRDGMRKYLIVGIVPDFIQGTTGSRAAGGLVVHNSALGIDTVGITGLSLVVRTISDATGVVPAVEQTVRDIFPNAARMRVASADQLLQNDLGRERLGASFFAGFGLVSLILGMIGVFGLVAHSAECRAQEMGVRLALGAPRYRVVLALTSNSLRPVAYGTLDGLVAAAILSNAVTAYLHGISMLDPVSYAGTTLMVLGAAIVASLMAAMRLRHLTPETLLRAS